MTSRDPAGAVQASPPPAGAQSYRWVSDAKALTGAWADASGGIPVLRPEQPGRHLRWQRVLDWYRPAPARLLGDQVLVCLTAGFAGLVEAFATATGQDWLQVPEGDWPAAVPPSRPVTVIARPAELAMARLHAWSVACPTAWSILPAIDLAGLSFALAKSQLGLPDPVLDWAIIDVIGERTTTSSDASPEPGVQLSLLSSGSRALALGAHGENGHANLGSHVLCGLVGDVERDPAGRPLRRGCADDGSQARCKRKRGRPIMHARDIRTADLLLFSCTTFSVAGDLFPSDVSLVTAALEGYARAVVSCDRAMPYHPAATESLVRLLDRVGTGALRELENDLQAPRLGSKPYYLAGHVTQTGSEAAPVVLEQPITAGPPTSPGGDGVLLLASGPAGHMGVLSAEPATVPVLRGNRWTRVLGGSITLRDASVRLLRHRDWQRGLTADLARVVRFQRAVLDLTDPDDVGRAALTRMTRTHGDLERLLQGALRLSEDTVRWGVWQPGLEQLEQIAPRYAARWDRACADAFEAGLLQHHALEQVLTDGLHHLGTMPEGHCQRCGSPEYVTTWSEAQAAPSAPSGSTGSAVSLAQCPHCGPREFWHHGGPRAVVDIPFCLAAGAQLTVRVAPGSASGPGVLVVEAKENGTDEVYARHRQAWTGAEVVVRFDVPDAAPADLQTVRVLLASGLGMTYQRHRSPCTA